MDPGGRLRKGQCLKLLRALYRMPRSPLLWYNELKSTMEKLGFTQVPECEYLFINRRIIVFFYIDDIVIMVYPQFRQDYLDFKAKLTKAYKMRDMGELK
jgi:hypothetical protein